MSNSPLVLLDFNILKTKLSFEHPEGEEEVNVVEMISKYPIELDFMIKKGNDNQFAIFTKILINDFEKKVPGHSIFAEGVTIFKINPDFKDITEKDIKALINYSAVTIAFNNLRGFVADLTAYTFPGKYLFPVFDLHVLLRRKIERNKEASKENPTPEKRKSLKVKK